MILPAIVRLSVCVCAMVISSSSGDETANVNVIVMMAAGYVRLRLSLCFLGHSWIKISIYKLPSLQYFVCVTTAHKSNVKLLANCNCNWGTCIAPPTRRPRAHHRVNPYPGAHRQNETEIFTDHDETSPSIAAVSAPSVASCSMLAVQQQKRLCHQFVDVSAARRGCCV